jgi:pyruvate, orthophosphate dikinase
MNREIILFGKDFAAPPIADVNALGRKAADLATMAQANIAVPASAVFPVSLIDDFLKKPNEAKTWLKDNIDIILQRFGVADETLLAVRLSPVHPVPGLSATVLGLGQTTEGFISHARHYGEDFAWRKRREMIVAYAEFAKGIGADVFEEALEDMIEFEASDQRMCEVAEIVFERETASKFEAGRSQQIIDAIIAAVASWNTPRAASYRALNGVGLTGGLALVLQKQVIFDGDSFGSTGNAITRSLENGSKNIHGLWHGINPKRLPISASQPEAERKPAVSLQRQKPELFVALQHLAAQLEATFHDAQKFEFVAGEGVVFAMSTAPAKPGIKAALRIACDLVDDGVAKPEDVLLQIDPLSLEQLIHRTIDPKATRDVIATGLAASPGAATGALVFSAAEAAARRAKGEACILVRTETSPEDVVGMAASDGVVTARGGLTSHAAVVARGMGKPCVTGASSLQIDSARRTFVANGRAFTSGQIVTIDGTLGEILAGAVPTVLPEISDDFATILGWADELRDLGIRANADMPSDAKTARDFGAEGIGLCRTEHMFFREDRVAVMREMILADSELTRQTALARLGPMQREDFEELFEIMAGMPVTLRLLDPPLHEFLPSRDHEFVDTARALGIEVESLRIRVDAMREVNPMLGHRGCRLAISHPEILDMQARAIFEAAMNVEDKSGRVIEPEIMIPFVSAAEEVRIVRARIEKMAEMIAHERGRKPHYSVGTMIELPRAALGADRIAKECTFFSFGTNDLTQTTYGISRDDSSPFLALYRERRVFQDDPFQKFDVIGAGELMRIATEKGRKERPELTIGVCGEHGGEPGSIAFFDSLGLDYISCSPYRVPIARLAAAQAAIRRKNAC